MTRSATTAVALVGAAALAAAAFAAPAQAAPNSKGNTEIIPNATLASLLVSADAPVTAGGDRAASSSASSATRSDGVIKHVGGITINTLTGGQLALSNFWIDTRGRHRQRRRRGPRPPGPVRAGRPHARAQRDRLRRHRRRRQPGRRARRDGGRRRVELLILG